MSIVSIKKGIYITGLTQLLTAVGQLVGIRILTEILPPGIFGKLALLLGVVALGMSLLMNPTMQALLRYFPAYYEQKPYLLKCVIFNRIKKTLLISLPFILPLVFLGITKEWFEYKEVILLLVLMLVDGMKSYQTTMLNAEMKHRLYGYWQASEAWARPIVAYIAVTFFSVNISTVLLAYIFISLLLYFVFYKNLAKNVQKKISQTEYVELFEKFRSYSKPLIPLAIIGWISGMADRYMIGGFLSLKDVGMYAAIYALASRPMLMLSSIPEISIRPLYYAAVSSHDTKLANKYLFVWFLIVAFFAIVLILFLLYFHELIAKLLLASEFREASYLMPWIGLGYGMLALSHITTRVCYAYDATWSVFLIELSGAMLVLLVGMPLVYSFGLLGAAISIPIYFGLQLLISTYIAFKLIHKAKADFTDNQVTIGR